MSRLPYSTRCAALAAGLGCLLGASVQAAESSARRQASDERLVVDLSEQVEVVPGGRLRRKADDRLEVGVSLWNPNDSDLIGPVFLIVDGTALEGVASLNHPEQTAAGKAVYELIGEGEVLHGHGMAPVLPLQFAAAAELTDEQLQAFRLTARVFGRMGEASKSARDELAEDLAQQVAGKSYDQEELQRVIAIQEKHTPDLAKLKDVIGTSVSENDRGELQITVYTETKAAGRRLPGDLEGVPVNVAAIPGGFKAGPATNGLIIRDGKYVNPKHDPAPPAGAAANTAHPRAGAAAPGGDPTIRFDRPVPIGISAFNATDVCAAGTLGCRCIDASGKLYALSNAHVFAKEGLSARGEAIIQPSQGDSGCVIDLAGDQIGQLADFVPFLEAGSALVPVNLVDCALVEVFEAENPDGDLVPAVDACTPEDGYGFPSSRILRATRIGQQVQKYGRTTVYTRGRCNALNVVSVIAYSLGDVAFIRMDSYFGMAPFASLGAPGDSGSLIVTLEDNRPVSLLFAGNTLTNTTFGNPIGSVLDRFNVKVDDGRAAAPRVGGPPGNIRSTGRGGLGVGQLGQGDLALLPPELRGRIKNPGNGLLPVLPMP